MIDLILSFIKALSALFIICRPLGLYIRVNNPSLNRNVGIYHLPHIWDEVLYNIPELKLK